MPWRSPYREGLSDVILHQSPLLTLAHLLVFSVHSYFTAGVEQLWEWDRVCVHPLTSSNTSDSGTQGTRDTSLLNGD